MNLTKIISSEFKTGVKNLIVKFKRYGKSDIRTATQSAPFGIDSRPPKGMIAVFSPTEEKGRSVVVGYINENLVAAEGEVRLFSVNASGQLQTYVWIKANGQILLGGDSRHLTAFEAIKSAWDAHISEYNLHSHPGHGSPPTQQSTSNVNNAKIDNVKAT